MVRSSRPPACSSASRLVVLLGEFVLETADSAKAPAVRKAGQGTCRDFKIGGYFACSRKRRSRSSSKICCDRSKFSRSWRSSGPPGNSRPLRLDDTAPLQDVLSCLSYLFVQIRHGCQLSTYWRRVHFALSVAGYTKASEFRQPAQLSNCADTTFSPQPTTGSSDRHQRLEAHSAAMRLEQMERYWQTHQ